MYICYNNTDSASVKSSLGPHPELPKYCDGGWGKPTSTYRIQD